MEQNSNKHAKKPATLARTCLCCGGGFVSASPFLRICEPCKAGEEWLSGNVDFILNDMERKVANEN